jgi:hypothetical protein
VKVLCSEGVATHTGPEPCVVVCKDGGEASVGDRIGQPLSRERNLNPGRRRRHPDGRQHGLGTIDASARPARRVEDPGMCGRSLYGNREIPRLAATCGRSASGRRGAVSRDARTPEVGLRRSS